MENRYGFGKSVAMSFDEAMAKVTAELQKEGFGILTEIDVAGTLKKKLDHTMPPWKTLHRSSTSNDRHFSVQIGGAASLIVPTPGGLVLAAEQIAKALAERKGKVTVFIPHYAMSGGTLIPLAADDFETTGRPRGEQRGCGAGSISCRPCRERISFLRSVSRICSTRLCNRLCNNPYLYPRPRPCAISETRTYLRVEGGWGG